MKKKILAVVSLCTVLSMLPASLIGCGSGGTESGADSAASSAESSAASSVESSAVSSEESSTKKEDSIDYLVLVNKLNKLPDDWEDNLETVHMKNSVGDDVEVEKKAYDAYLKLKEDLEKEDIHVDLDSARRSVKEQSRIMDDFVKK